MLAAGAVIVSGYGSSACSRKKRGGVVAGSTLKRRVTVWLPSPLLTGDPGSMKRSTSSSPELHCLRSEDQSTKYSIFEPIADVNENVGYFAAPTVSLEIHGRLWLAGFSGSKLNRNSCPLVNPSPSESTVRSANPLAMAGDPARRAIQKEKVDHVLIVNPGLRGKRFEVINDVQLKPNGHSLLETLCIWVPLGL